MVFVHILNLLKPSGNFTYHMVVLTLNLCFVWISEQTATFALYGINGLVFITEKGCVYCVVQTESLYRVLHDFRA